MRTGIKNAWTLLEVELNNSDAYTPEESLEAIEDIISDLEIMKGALENDIAERDSEKE